MKRWVWLPIFVLALIAAGVTLVARQPAPDWTSSSAEAREEFEAGLEDQAKVYTVEAREHFRRAIELDPGFLIAKYRFLVMSIDSSDGRNEQLIKELMTADLTGLTERERFIISRWRANMKYDSDEAERLLDDYVARHPNDPYGISITAATAWLRGDFETAEPLYRHLLSIDPNWVTAYNSLGYMAMRQGRFTEAEEYFKSYRFVVPDQANPHDSLGDLFIILGRYNEAEDSLERAIEIKPDFWASYEHLAFMKAHSGDPAGARLVIERAKIAGIPEESAERLGCLTDYAEMADRGEWKQILAERGSRCLDDPGSIFPLIVTHRAACRLKRWDVAQSLEDAATSRLIAAQDRGDREGAHLAQTTVHHLQGVRMAVRGDLETAQARLQAVDSRIEYIQSTDAFFKLYNSIILAEVMLAAGEDAEAHLLLSRVRAVNPPVVAEFELSGFKALGLRRA